MAPARPHLLVTGFGPFFRVDDNPSRAVAFALADAPPPGVRIRAAELPVDVAASARALESELRRAPDVDAVLALGVQEEGYYRVERRARHRLSARKPDNAGVVPAGHVLEPARDFETAFDVDLCAAALRASGAGDVRTSDDAGGFVCERVYHHLLAHGAERRLPGLFLHLPPAGSSRAEEQVPHVRALVLELVRQTRALSGEGLGA